MPRHSPYALLCLNYLFKSDLRSHLKLFSRLLELLCLRTFFYSYFSFVYFAWRNFNTFVTCFTNYGKTWFWFLMIFSLLSLSCTLIRFSMSIQASLFLFRVLSGFTTTRYLYQVFVKTGNLLGRLVMGSSGLEPPTSRLSGARSNLLSYEPVRENGPRKPFS